RRKKAARLSGPGDQKRLSRLLCGCNCRGGGGLFGLDLLPVVLDEILLLAVAHAGIEFVLFHLGHCLLEVPVVVVESIYGAQHSGAMPASGTMQEELSCCR